MNLKIYIISALFTCLMLQAQNYTWQWGQYGGGSNSSNTGLPAYQNDTDENIRDIAVDSDNNYYYLSTINPGNPSLNGNPISTLYGKKDLFLFSTDCQGTVRWTRTIGGSTDAEYAWKIELDNNGGLYILGIFSSRTGPSFPGFLPVYFDENNSIPITTIPYSDQTSYDPGLKNAYLLKYKTNNGTLEWHKELQGDVTWSLANADTAILTMDSSKNIHAILGFRAGSHLNGTITVPASYTDSYQYYLVKFAYDNGNMTPELNPLLLPITGTITQGLTEGKVNLVFDEVLDRYYLAGKRMEYGTGIYSSFSYGGVPFSENAYLLAFNGSTGSEVWRREIDNTHAIPGDRIDDIVMDAAGNIFITGFYTTIKVNNISQPVTFNKPAGQTNPNYNLPNTGNTNPFVIKLNSDGDILWHTIASGYSTSVTETGYQFSKGRLALNGNEVAFAKGSVGDTWGSFPMVRPANDNGDPLLVRLHKDTGAVLGAHDILSGYGTMDELTAVAVDQDGNYVVGGFKHSSLFLDPNDGVPDLHGNTLSGKSQFFFAKLATSSSCTHMNTAETPVKQTDVVFYPNPVNDVLHIKTKEKLTSYEVITADGRLMKQGKFSGNFTIDMSGVATGVYYVKVQGDGFATAGKIVKK